VEAAEAFEALLKADPNLDDARLALGACQLHLSRTDEALKNFERCWSSASRARAVFGKAVALQLLDRPYEAAKEYRRLLEIEPESQEALANLIALSIQEKDWEGARRNALRLIGIAPQSLAALKGLAAVALERGEYEAVVQYCGRIVEQAPDCIEAWHNLRYATGRVMSALHPPAVSAPRVNGR
jgi:tetratricopeptide (TPR) repeat protein